MTWYNYNIYSVGIKFQDWDIGKMEFGLLTSFGGMWSFIPFWCFGIVMDHSTESAIQTQGSTFIFKTISIDSCRVFIFPSIPPFPPTLFSSLPLSTSFLCVDFWIQRLLVSPTVLKFTILVPPFLACWEIQVCSSYTVDKYYFPDTERLHWD